MGKQGQIALVVSRWAGMMLFLNLAGGGGYAWGQVSTFLPSEQHKIAGYARELLENQFLGNLELLTHYPSTQPKEALQDHIAAMTRDAFLKSDVLMFNEFQPPSTPRTTLNQYINDCRINSGGKPLRNLLGLDSARYWFGQSAADKPFVNVYAYKRITGKGKAGKLIDHHNLIEFRVAFLYDARQKYSHTFRIAGIEKVMQWPAAARWFAREPTIDPIDLNTVASQVIGQLVTSLPVGTQQVVLERFTYDRCNITNPLSDQLYAALNTQFPTRTGTAVSVNATDESSLRLRGWYVVPDGAGRDKLRVEAELYDPATKRVLASTRYDQLPLLWLSAQKLDWLPEGYGIVKETNQVIEKESTRPAVPDLEVRLQTNRGREGAEFWEGDTLRLQVQANRPCYLRLINLQANGDRVILQDNLEIKSGEQGKYFPLGEAYTCEAPFGSEHILVYASLMPLRPLPTTPQQGGYVRREGGYQVFVGSLADLIRFSASTKDGKVAQDKIQVTTRAKRKEKK